MPRSSVEATAAKLRSAGMHKRHVEFLRDESQTRMNRLFARLAELGYRGKGIQ